MSIKRRAGSIMAAAAFGLVGGCEKLTREHFEQIRVHMDAKGDVEKLIGPPDYKLPAQWHYEREDDHLVVRVDFDEKGVVSRKQWIDAMHGKWQDSSVPADKSAGADDNAPDETKSDP